MLSRQNKELFCTDHLEQKFAHHRRALTNHISRIPKDQLLSASVDTLVEHVLAEVEIEPLRVSFDEKAMVTEEAQVDISHRERIFREKGGEPLYVPGVRVRVLVPFVGDPDLWQLRTRNHRSTFPRGVVERTGSFEGTLEIILENPADTRDDELKRELARELAGVEFYVSRQAMEISEFNGDLPMKAHGELEARRERLRSQAGLSEMLGIPLQSTGGTPERKPIHLEKRQPKPLPPAPEGGYQPEFGITPVDFERILMALRTQGRTFETTPGTFVTLGEEDLRNLFLGTLCTHFERGATGETFRYRGKTDIRIEAEDRSAFIGECKVWKGPKKLADAVDQLLGYLTWRDCRLAILIFNKGVQDLSRIVDAVPRVISSHKQFMREHAVAEEGEWRFDLRSMSDDSRELHLHVFVFNLVSPK